MIIYQGKIRAKQKYARKYEVIFFRLVLEAGKFFFPRLSIEVASPKIRLKK